MTLHRKLAVAFATAALPVLLYGFSGGPPIRRTGAPVDNNGATCTGCHVGNPLNPPGGFVRIETDTFTPGTKQIVRVTVSHPEARRWGFQLTARLVADPTKKAGTFTYVTGGPIRVVCDNGTVRTEANDCGDVVEFASHGGNPDSTFGGTAGAKTFTVEWTPPVGDVGDVVFYAAGNAANESNNPTGDRVYNTSLRIRGDSPCNYAVQPRPQGIGNAATSRAGVSAGGLLSIYGNDFVPQGVRKTAGLGDIRDSKYPNELRCIAVEVGGVRAPITHVQSDQINVQVPALTTSGPVPVRVIVNPGRPGQVTLEAGMVTIQNFGPAFFTFNGSSIASRVPGEVTPIAQPSVVTGARPARPGEIIELYATGLGAVTTPVLPGDLTGSGLNPLQSPVSITIGGTTLAAADIIYAGQAPSSISGLFQINVRVPAAAPNGDLPVTMTIGGVTSPTGTTIPVLTPIPQ